jgi:hypothetical protein
MPVFSVGVTALGYVIVPSCHFLNCLFFVAGGCGSAVGGNGIKHVLQTHIIKYGAK